MWNIKALALTVQKLLARIKFQRGGQNDRMTDRTKTICSPIFDLRGIKNISVIKNTHVYSLLLHSRSISHTAHPSSCYSATEWFRILFTHNGQCYWNMKMLLVCCVIIWWVTGLLDYNARHFITLINVCGNVNMWVRVT